MSSINWEKFYTTLNPPQNVDQVKQKIVDFHNLNTDKKIAVITSGGTTVPMEHNTVRFVDNFSAGTRGSASVEYFIEQGYAVLFLYRNNSIRPYVRHFSGEVFLDSLEVSNENPNSISVKSELVPKVRSILDRYSQVKKNNLLLNLEFTTLSEYLWLLRIVCESLQPGGARVLLYLAAAVADFYIPADQMPEHKMQSGDGPPVISLQLVPKMLSPLTSVWSPQAFVVSFKLETDASILVKKSKAALNKYHHKLVIGNLLHSRKYQVILVSPDSVGEDPIELSERDREMGVEIEKYLVQEVVRRHQLFLLQHDGK